MHTGMDRERGGIDRIVPFDDLALVVHQDQVGYPDLSEVYAERVDPKPFRIAGIASRNVAGDTLIVSEPGKQAKRGSQALLAVPPLLGYRAEGGRFRYILGSSGRFRHRAISSLGVMIYRPLARGQIPAQFQPSIPQVPAGARRARRPSSLPLWIARLFTGRVLCETLTRDIVADPAALTETGFAFLFPSYRAGLPRAGRDVNRIDYCFPVLGVKFPKSWNKVRAGAV